MAMLHLDPDLVPAAREDLPGARDALLDACLAPVLAWCRRLGGSKVDAEDAAHDVLVVVLTRLGQLEQDDRFESWLYGVTRRVLAGHRRKAWVRRWVPGKLPEAIDPGASPFAEAALSETAAEVRDVLDRLPARQREVLVLCEVEDRTDVETAELLGVPVGTVKSRLRLARNRFRSIAQRRPTLATLYEAPSWGQ
jgi:RNA polymerase sigma-70 factor, ECF subfamily